MKKLLFSFVAFTLVFSGCISKRPIPVEQKSFDENAIEIIDPLNRFTLTLPEGYSFVDETQQATARIYRINEEAAGQTKMYLEENQTTVDIAVDSLLSQDAATEIRREPVTINGLSGTKLVIEIETVPDREAPYYFLQGGDYVYVFSLPLGEPWEYFEAVVNSFQLS